MLVMTRSLKETLENEAYEHACKAPATQVGTTGGKRCAGWSCSRRFRSPRIEDPAQHLAGVSSLAHEGPAWLEGALGHGLERATSTWLAAQPPFLLMTLRGRLYLRLQLASAGCDRCRRGGRPVPDRGRAACARRPHARRRAGALDRVELDRLAVAAAGTAALAGRLAQPCLPSSILAIALRWTSSGPSAKRSVRAPA